MNKGIKIARGEYINFINGGDRYAHDGVLEEIFSVERRYQDIIVGDIKRIERDGSVNIKRHPDKIGIRFLTLNSINHQATFYRRTLFETHGLFDITLNILADYEFSLRAIVSGRCSVKHIDTVIGEFYRDGVSSLESFRDAQKHERLIAQKMHMPRVVYYFTSIRFCLIRFLRPFLPSRLLQMRN